MHKLKITFLLFAAAFILSGCSDAARESAVFEDTNEQQSAPSEPAAQEAAVGTTDDNFGSSPVTIETPAPGVDPSTVDEMIVTAGGNNQIVIFKTSMGDITVELFLENMPITAGNFLKLAQDNFYDGITFHRVIPNFMIQGGDPLSRDDNPDNDGTGGPGYFIDDEFYLDFTNERGTLAMANSGPNTGGSQFFINIVNNDFLDSKHPVFGRVVEGMDIIDAIVAVERDARDRPLSNVVIEDIVVE